MAGVILTSATQLKSGITRYRTTWVSDAAGTVSGSTFVVKTGTIIAVEFTPGVGLTQPDDLYDLDCLDSLGISVLDNGAGATVGANLSNVTAQHFVPATGLAGSTVLRRWLRGGTLQPTVVNAGDTNSAIMDIYVVDGLL